MEGALRLANPALDARLEATRAVALADGLAWQSICAPDLLTPRAAEQTLDVHLARLAP